MTLASIVSGLTSTVTTLIEAELATNPKVSEAQVVALVQKEVDSLLVKAGPLGTIVEPVVNYFIAADVPAIYTKIVQNIAGTAAGSAIVVGQSAS